MIKSTRLRRDWSQAVEKVRREGGCRVCGSEDVQAAHIIGRKCDVEMVGPRGGKYLLVHPDAIVPLCGEWFGVGHHQQYDNRELDLLSHLHLHEQVRAVEDAGGILSALKRISGLNA